jgi:hypothetical protein
MMDGHVFGIAAHDEKEAYTNLLEAVKIAESATKQLALYTDRREWLIVGLQFAQLREATTALMLSGMFKRG